MFSFAEIISAAEIILVFYFTRNHHQWLRVKQNTEIFQNNFLSNVTIVSLQSLWQRVRVEMPYMMCLQQ